MNEIKKNEKANQPAKKSEMNDRGDSKREISSGSKSRPGIDQPLKGSRSDSDMASSDPSKHDRNVRNDNERSSR